MNYFTENVLKVLKLFDYFSTFILYMCDNLFLTNKLLYSKFESLLKAIYSETINHFAACILKDMKLFIVCNVIEAKV